jgi:hypothetical protein
VLDKFDVKGVEEENGRDWVLDVTFPVGLVDAGMEFEEGSEIGGRFSINEAPNAEVGLNGFNPEKPVLWGCKGEDTDIDGVKEVCEEPVALVPKKEDVVVEDPVGVPNSEDPDVEKAELAPDAAEALSAGELGRAFKAPTPLGFVNENDEAMLLISVAPAPKAPAEILKPVCCGCCNWAGGAPNCGLACCWAWCCCSCCWFPPPRPIVSSNNVGCLVGIGGGVVDTGPKGFFVPVWCLLTGWTSGEVEFCRTFPVPMAVSGVDIGRVGISMVRLLFW